jgi:chaperone required for assembly of F1-ATPase
LTSFNRLTSFFGFSLLYIASRAPQIRSPSKRAKGRSRATEPVELIARQQEIWQPLLDWAADRIGARLRVTAGIAPIDQPAPALAVLRDAVAERDDPTLAGLHALTAATGSLVIALAALEAEIDGDALWRAAQLDEDWQIERWGEDAEAAARRTALRADIDTTLRFLALVAAG